MPSFTNCVLVGHLGKDAETRTYGDNKTMTTFTLAIGHYDKTTSWTLVKLFGRVAEWSADLKKGDCVVCTGMEYKVEEYEKEGEKKRSHVFIGGITANVVKAAKHESKPEEPEESGVTAKDLDDLPF